MGNPVAHSRSPWIHARFAELTGQSLEYRALLVPADGFPDAVHAFRGAGGRGCNVTVPFKFEAAALCAGELSARAELAGACNTLVFDGPQAPPRGDNTDGVGLVRDIEHHAGVNLAGAHVLLVGAGGAAAGVLGPLIEANPARLTVTNRTLANAQLLVTRHQDLAARRGVRLDALPLDAVDRPHDIVINGTASSLGGDAVPVSGRVLREGGLAIDMMYGPAAQGFLDWARRHGGVPRDGLGMLVEQAAESFSIWRGLRPPAAQVLHELRQLLAPAGA
ncbi:shikimate dehydrogenase [Ramlibacter sp. AW1]|uniref:shikimate dehydrogenase (NADP(+)) n=2 Tax=Ramlibacter aurantiacus TaxID=2801330 RepID=A0A936ZSX6_9BURK|nr:shikimate dehydrogenase [Ramlibacter aurantiacus]